MSVLDLLSPLPTFVGFQGTIYSRDDNERDTIVYHLHTSETVRNRFKKYVLVHEDGTKVHCQEWNDFLRHL